jgi:hypothetical protein
VAKKKKPVALYLCPRTVFSSLLTGISDASPPERFGPISLIIRAKAAFFFFFGWRVWLMCMYACLCDACTRRFFLACVIFFLHTH